MMMAMVYISPVSHVQHDLKPTTRFEDLGVDPGDPSMFFFDVRGADGSCQKLSFPHSFFLRSTSTY